jgi:hypothetical protein
MITKKYLSTEWKFVEPLSTRTRVKIDDFRVACWALEYFLAEKGLHLKKYQFYGFYGKCGLILELDYADCEILKEERFQLYEFLHKNLPVKHGVLDWFNDPSRDESFSYICVCTQLNTTYLSLILDYGQSRVEFPSPDVLYMSRALNKKFK